MKKTSVKYEILSELPIEVVVDAEATSATICWEYKATICYDNNECKTDEFPSKECQSVEIEPNNKCEENIIEGQFKWQRKTIKYKITQKGNPQNCECKKPFEGDKYELLDYWLEKDVFECEIPEGEDSPLEFSNYDTKLFYKYNKLSVNDKCEIVKTEVTTSTTVTIRCVNHGQVSRVKKYLALEMPDGTHQTIDYGYVCDACKGKCKKESQVKIGGITYDIISYDKEGNNKKNVKHSDYVTCSGTTCTTVNGVTKCINEVNYTVEYIKYDRDEDCKVTETNGIYNGTWKVPHCNGDDCCSSHYVTTSITIDDESSDLNGKSINLSVLMKGDSERQCNPNCECQKTILETQYCVDLNSIKVYYPKTNEGGTTEWTEEGFVSKYGGDVKVAFGYTAFTDQLDCSDPPVTTTDETTGTYEEIINVPPSWISDDVQYSVGTLTGEIEFKIPRKNCTNEFTYEVKQELPS